MRAIGGSYEVVSYAIVERELVRRCSEARHVVAPDLGFTTTKHSEAFKGNGEAALL